MNSPISRTLLFALCALFCLLPGCGKKELPGSAPAPQQAPGASVVRGVAAPDFTLTGLDGSSITLSSLRGKVVLVNFWATWCPPCRQEIPSMEKLWQQFGKDGMVILAISVDKGSSDDLKAFVKETGMTFPVFRDNEGGKLGKVAEGMYGITGVPESFVVDRQGIVQEKIIGSIEWDKPEVIEYFTKLLKK